MPAPQATSDLYATLQQYELMLVTAGRRLWRRMLPGDFDGSWSRIAPQMVAFTSGAQLAAAQAAVAYVPAVLDETGQPDQPEARVRPQAFAGVASDGRSLVGLLQGSVVAAKRATMPSTFRLDDGQVITRPGLDGGDALKLGEKWLEQALQSAVADAMRDATAASIAVRPEIGYVRMVNPPCCSRCAVLAGVVYRFHQPFLRHPQCDCLHIPTTLANADSFLSDPNELVRRGMVNDLSKNQRGRLNDGADLPKVLNESRDRWRVGMAGDRRAARRAGYTPAELQAADRRAARRTTWGADTAPVVPRSPAEFMTHLTSRADAINKMRAAGIAE